jgi:hypothetical protein
MKKEKRIRADLFQAEGFVAFTDPPRDTAEESTRSIEGFCKELEATLSLPGLSS